MNDRDIYDLDLIFHELDFCLHKFMMNSGDTKTFW